MHLVIMMADEGGQSTVMREYRKGNWTVNETMVLIEAKKMDDERRMKRNEDTSEVRGKPTELRWKWVEDYCWRRGCSRSQNQCNDKWDNLMRDYKKVREYQRRVIADQSNEKSYWEMEKNERKEKNLPSNMLSQTYKLLEEVVEKKIVQRVTAAYQLPPIPAAIPLPMTAPPQLPPPPTVAAPAPLLQTPLAYAQPLPVCGDSSDSETNEHSDSQAKRRRRNGEGTSSARNSNDQKVGTAIYKSAAIIAETMQANEEHEERRHRDLVGLHERRLKVEESKTEINRRGIDGVVDAINKLANSILALASSNKNQSATK